jgi:hypothetical protein
MALASSNVIVASSARACVRPDDFSPRPAVEAITSTTYRVIPRITDPLHGSSSARTRHEALRERA